jgi:alpha-galactosidase
MMPKRLISEGKIKVFNIVAIKSQEDDSMGRIEMAPYVPYDQGPAHLHIPTVYGASPNKPMLWAIPATGVRPLRYAVDPLPAGLMLDPAQGFITGVPQAGAYNLKISVTNDLGTDEKPLRLIVKPDGAGLTPMMGWCSWNAYGKTVSQDKIERTADLLLSSGLSSYGYQFVNTDSAWQGEYGGPHDAFTSNEKFPDMKAMTDHIHSLGLKAGIYSTPMQKAWGGGELAGCTRGRMDNRWPNVYYGIGEDHREQACVDQWTEWGFDYLKYDWSPCDPHNAELMKDCLRRSNRDFQFCVTVRAGIEHADYWKKNCSHWRDNIDSSDTWDNVLDSKFKSDFWAEHISPGHFFDMDMMENGWICNHMTGEQRACRLTENEQIVAYTMRAIFPSPIQISCDLGKLSDFDKALLCNEEVISVNQDAWAIGAVCVYEEHQRNADRMETVHKRIYARPLEDGSVAVAMFNLSSQEETLSLPLDSTQVVRDLWAKRDLGEFSGAISLNVPPHAVRLLKFNSK